MSRPNFSLLVSNKLPIGREGGCTHEIRTGPSFTFSLLFSYLLLASLFLLFTEKSAAASLQSAGQMLYVLTSDLMLYAVSSSSALFHRQRCESRDKGRLLSWLIVTQWHPATIVTETDCNSTSRHHRPERCFNKNNFQMDSDSAPVGDSVPYRRQPSALEPQKCYFPLSKCSVKESA